MKIVGWILNLLGVLILAFSSKIVFPGLERILGIETIVGKENVVHLSEGGYAYTNPAAIFCWIFLVAAIGAIIAMLGCWFLYRARKIRR
jgi:hypothetical protein